jgi:hypothetical protein
MSSILRATLIAAVLATAAAGAAAAADRAVRPVVAAPAAAGDLLLGFGPVFIDGAPSDEHFWQFNSSGRASFAVGPRWNIEAEANAKAGFESASGFGVAGFPFQADATLHFWARHAASSAWGVFANVSPFEVVFWSLGGEFRHYLPHASFGAAAAVTVVPAAFSSPSQTGWTLSASGNWYLNPNHRIGLSAAMMTGFDFSGGEPWQLTADFEHRSATLPVSLWLSATRMRGAGNTSAWIALAGFRIFMDRPGSTLQSHEQDVPFAFQLPQLVSGGIL